MRLFRKLFLKVKVNIWFAITVSKHFWLLFFNQHFQNSRSHFMEIWYSNFIRAGMLKTICHYKKTKTCRVLMISLAYRFLYENTFGHMLDKNIFRQFRIKITYQYVIIAWWELVDFFFKATLISNLWGDWSHKWDAIFVFLS